MEIEASFNLLINPELFVEHVRMICFLDTLFALRVIFKAAQL